MSWVLQRLSRPLFQLSGAGPHLHSLTAPSKTPLPSPLCRARLPVAPVRFHEAQRSARGLGQRRLQRKRADREAAVRDPPRQVYGPTGGEREIGVLRDVQQLGGGSRGVL